MLACTKNREFTAKGSPMDVRLYAEGLRSQNAEVAIRAGDSSNVRLQISVGSPREKRGSDEINFVDMRRQGMFHNDFGMPYMFISLGMYIDAFRVYGRSNTHGKI